MPRPGKSKKPRATPAIRALREALLELIEEDDQELTCGDVLRALSPRFRTLGRSLTWLVAYDDGPLHGRAFSLLHACFQEPGIARKLQDKIRRQLVPMAEKSLRDAGLDERRKLNLVALLRLAGEEASDEILAESFGDIREAFDAMARETVAQLLDSVDQAEMLLRQGGLLDDEPVSTDGLKDRVQNALTLAAIARESNARVASTLFTLTAAIGRERGYGDEEELCDVLRAAAQTDGGRALALLSELGGWPHTGALGETARSLCAELRAAGVTPRPLAVPAFSHGLVSAIDGSGARTMQLQFRHDGSFDALSILLKDSAGCTDLWSGFQCGAELEERLRSMDMRLAPCDLPFARALLADAFAVGAANGRPPPAVWLLFAGFLGAPPLEPTRYEPDLGPYLLETFARGPKLAARSDELIDDASYATLGFDCDAAYAFVRRHPPRGKGYTAARLTSFIGAVEPHERERLLRRLAINLELEARAGRVRRATNRLAAATWIVLHERLLPFAEVPWVRALAADSVERTAYNLSRGYQSQAEANQAALERDGIDGPDFLDELIDMMPELFPETRDQDISDCPF